ncbi:MAG TPA: hypothetical protein VFL12_02335, partial [Thermoanaerobaculia bacterium]|nr:hypothetical protein [Thermoanaerobaculia bacterium]
MTRAAGVRIAVLLCAARLAGGAAAPAAAPFGNAPYDAPAPAAAAARIRVRVDTSAAEQILEALSRDKPKPGEAGALEGHGIIHRQISESGKGEAVWIEDFAAAFLPESQPGTFDLRSVRLDRERWRVALDGVRADAAAIAAGAASRAAALLPEDPPVTLDAEIDLTFALAGIEDHVLFTSRDGRAVVLVDLGRAISENPGNPRADTAEALSRLAAAETFRAAWDVFLRASPAWQKPDEGPTAPLLRATATVAPIALFSFDRNFFPLSRWLHDDLIHAIDAFNQEVALLADPKTEIGKRAEVLAALRKPGLRPDPALSAGAFLADAVFQAGGRPALVGALASGPDGLFETY